MRKLTTVVVFSALLCLKAFPSLPYNLTGKEDKLQLMPPDTAKVNLLIELGTHYCSRNYEKALLYLQEALVLSTELNYSRGIACSMLWQGRAYYYKDEYEIAYTYLEKAKAILKEIGYNKGLASYHYAVGSIYNINGNYLDAIRNFQEAIELSEALNDKVMMANCYHSLGILHLHRSELKLAFGYFKQARALNVETGQLSAEATNLAGIGMVHESQGMYDSALHYFERVLQIKSSLEEPRGIAGIQYSIGKVFLKTARYNEAREMFETSMAIFSSINDLTGICINRHKLAETLNYLGKSEIALKNAFGAISLARKINNPNLVSKIYASLASIMAYNGRFKEAYEYNILNTHLKDSMAEANREKLIHELELKFQVSRKDSEIQLWKSRNQVQAKNNLLLSISFISLVAIFLLLLFFFRMKTKAMKRQKKIYEQEKTIHRQQSELRDKEQQLLKRKLEAKNRELASKALEMLRINETIGEIIEKLENVIQKTDVSEDVSNHIMGIAAGLEAQLRDNSWNEFEKIFTNIHSDFFQRLLHTCPDLTPAEIKVAALLKLNISTKEIAALTFKSEAGIKSARYRLRKKLQLKSDDSLVPYLMKL